MEATESSRMDTTSPSYPKYRNLAAMSGLRTPQWKRALIFFSLLILAECALAYLLSWVDPPPQGYFVTIAVTDYQARPLASLLQVNGGSSLDMIRSGTTRDAILQTLDALAKCSNQQPVVIHLSA